MKRGDIVFSQKHGIAVVVGHAAPGDETLAMVAYVVRPAQEGPHVEFAILNESDAIPIELPVALEQIRGMVQGTLR